MAAQWQLVHLPLGGGINEDADVRLVQPPEVVDASELDNVRFDKRGRWIKRNGWTDLAGTSNEANTLFEHERRAIAIDYDGVTWHYNPDDDAWSAWAPPSDTGAEQPRVVPLEVNSETVAENEGVVMCDLMSAFGTICYAWINSAGFLYARIVDATTGAMELGTRELVSSTKTWARCRVVRGSTHYCVIAEDDAGGGLYMWYIDMSSAPTSWTAVGNITTDLGPFDAANALAGSFIGIAVYDGTRVNVYEVTQTGSMSSATALTGEVEVFDIAYRSSNSDWVVTTADAAGDVGLTVVNVSALTIQAGPTRGPTLLGSNINQATSVEGDNGNWWTVWEEEHKSGTIRHLVSAREFSESGGTISTAGNLCQTLNVKITAKAWIHDGEPVVPCQYDPGSGVSIPQPCGIIIRTRNEPATTWSRQFSAVGRYLVDRIDRKATAATSLSQTVAVDGDASRLSWCAAAYGANLDKTGVVRVEAETDPLALPVVKYEKGSYIGGGLLFTFDGQFPVETSPNWGPADVSATASAGGGGVGAGTYQYKCVWEWEDANGVLHRSAPSAAASVTTSASDTVTVKCVSIEELAGFFFVRGASRATTDVMPKLAVYRTQVDGTVFNLLTREVPALDTEAGTVKITDTSTDAAIASNELLYTEGGVLDAEIQPPGLDYTVANGRMWMIHAEKRDEVWPSKLLQPTIAPEWNAALAIKMPEECTAIASLSGRVVAFSKTRAYQIAGEGPANTGLGGSFAGPFELPGAPGCVDRAALGRCPMGLVVQSERGIELVTHNGQGTFVGRPVHETFDALLASEDVASILDVPSQGEVRVLLTKGEMLTWDYLQDKWGYDLNIAQWTRAAAVIDGVYHVWDFTFPSTAAVKKEDLSTRDDDGTHVTMKVATPWIAVGGPHGDSRIRRVFLGGENLEDHALTVKIRYDYVDSDVDTLSFTYSEIGAVDPPYDIELRPSRRKCRAIKLIITDATGATAADGPAFSSMAIEAAFTGKGRRITTSARK